MRARLQTKTAEISTTGAADAEDCSQRDAESRHHRRGKSHLLRQSEDDRETHQRRRLDPAQGLG